MSPRTPEQFEEIRESRREQIMETALKVFASEGYANSSISKLAEAAGISKGLMYNYFNSKEELLKEILEKGMKEILNLTDPDRDGIITPSELDEFIRKTFRIMRRKQEFWILYFNIILQPKVRESLKGTSVLTGTEEYFSMLMKYFESNGFEDPVLEVLTITSMIEGLGVLMLYAYPVMTIPETVLLKFEERVLKMIKQPEHE
ncbi:MAG: TetR/AcrR family transcriptional regulator [Bacteroidales bacterium]|nr:TetR/AcrR family transcriptional regulator [Bacteroidales bacterium]MBN2697824.1 TetR/AcrR family transcriptional regulator [Bacteroidales bacterium]